MKKVLLLIICMFMVLACGKSIEPRYTSTADPAEIRFLPHKIGTKFGYLYFTHDKTWGNPTNSHIVVDNCRKAGIFHSDTFIVVKLLPGDHVIKIVRPPERYGKPHLKANRAELVLPPIRGGEIFVYDVQMGFNTGMAPVEIKMEDLKGMAVSKDCLDCYRDPNPVDSFNKECYK